MRFETALQRQHANVLDEFMWTRVESRNAIFGLVLLVIFTQLWDIEAILLRDVALGLS